MPSPLSDLQQLRTVLGRLDAERPASSEILDDRMPYVEREDGFQRRLELELLSRKGKARLLVSGQIGVGKSSELRRYAFEHKQLADSFYIFSDLEKEMQPEHCGAAAALLAIFRDCWSAASSYGGTHDPERRSIRNATIETLVDWLKGEYKEEKRNVVFRFHGMEYPVSLTEPSKDSGLLLILGKAALHQAVSQPADRFGLIPDTLLNQLNRLLNWIQQKSRRQPVILVDHVDKIRDPNAAKEVLVDAHPQWQRLAASLVITAPFEYTLGDLRNSVESRLECTTACLSAPHSRPRSRRDTEGLLEDGLGCPTSWFSTRRVLANAVLLLWGHCALFRSILAKRLFGSSSGWA